MKTDRIRRAGVTALAVVGVLAASLVLPSKASAYANFARRYGVDCSVCHMSFPHLTMTGAKFRMAGYRMPDEIGNEAKWSNWGDNTSIKMKESFSAVTSNTGSVPSSENNGFVNSGLEWFPIEGAFGKYVAANSEFDVTAAGAAGVTDVNLMATFPINADSFLTTRVGLMPAFQGYGASDSKVAAALSSTFLPTPTQVTPVGGASFAYNKFAAVGEGIELAYNWKDTHVSAQITNGYNSALASTQKGEDNHFKDFSFFVNQMLPGENAIAAHFYKGTSNYSAAGAGNGTPYGAVWYDHYLRGILYGTIKFLKDDKLNLLVGFADGTDHVYDANTKNSSDQFHSMGWFATLQSVQHVMDQQLTSVLTYGTNRKSTATAGNRVSDITASLIVPIQNNKFDLSFQTRRTQGAGAVRDTTANTVQAQYLFMF